MGVGYDWKCDNCGYTYRAFLGVGFMFPMVYGSTIEDMRKGKYGERWKRFFEENPKGAITCQQVLLRCKSCGEYGSAPELKVFIPKTKNFNPSPKGRWSVAFDGGDYVSDEDLERYYDYYGQYEHKCPKCDGEIEVVEDIEKLKCPDCKGVMHRAGVIMWD